MNFRGTASQGDARLDQFGPRKTKLGGARFGTAALGKARQGKVYKFPRLGEPRRHKAGFGMTERGEARQGKVFMKANELSENIKCLMSPEDLKSFNLKRPLSELEIHSKFVSWLRDHRLGYYHADPTRAATIAPGTPDFGVYDESRIMFVEFKVGDNDLSPVQKRKIATLVDRKNVVFVCRSLEQAKELTKKFFHLKGAE